MGVENNSFNSDPTIREEKGNAVGSAKSANQSQNHSTDVVLSSDPSFGYWQLKWR